MKQILKVGDIDEQKAIKYCNNAAICKHPIFRPMKIDLFNIEETASLINKEKPLAVINCLYYII